MKNALFEDASPKGDQMIRVLEALQQNMRVLMNEVAERALIPQPARKEISYLQGDMSAGVAE